MSDTKQILLDISYDCIDSLVRDELKVLKTNLERDLKNRINDVGIPVFSTDKDTDIKEIQSHIEAVDKVLSWYGVINE
jgi:rRNA-processing protein FCF1